MLYAWDDVIAGLEGSVGMFEWVDAGRAKETGGCWDSNLRWRSFQVLDGIQEILPSVFITAVTASTFLNAVGLSTTRTIAAGDRVQF